MLKNIDDRILKNRQKFEALKKLNLPVGAYFVVGSGPLGIRGLREMSDVDIHVTPELWKSLSAKYGVEDFNGLKKIVFPVGMVEAYGEGSFCHEVNDPTEQERMAKADKLEGLLFDSLEHTLFFKKKSPREKDLSDIALLEKILQEKFPFEVRAKVTSLEAVTERLIQLKATFINEYAFTDTIYHPRERDYDFKKEYVRLRVYQKTAWDQKKVELVYKLKSDYTRTLYKKQLESVEEALHHLSNHRQIFSYSRKGWEYSLGDLRFFVEAIDDLPPTLEILSPSQKTLDAILKELPVLQLYTVPVPMLAGAAKN